MQNATRSWLSYTDGLLAQGGPAAEEINALMDVQRGPDYVRLKGGKVSPDLEDRKKAKVVTTAILRHACFPNASKSSNKGSELVKVLQRDFGYSQADAEKAAGVKFQAQAGSRLAGPGVIPERLLADELGNKSHFVIKVRKAMAILGITAR